MDEIISYGVFWKSNWNPKDFKLFSGWYTNYEDAYKVYVNVQKNPACIATRIIEMCEHFEVVAEAEVRTK